MAHDDLSDDILWHKHSLLTPAIPRGLQNTVRVYDITHVATAETPAPMDDYRYDITLNYLQTVIPDQYSISHAGHGLNSYALNFRLVYGDLALLVQTAFGGVYGDLDDDKAAWNEYMAKLKPALARVSNNGSSEPKQRKVLVSFSNFREQAGEGMQGLPVFRVNKDGVWGDSAALASWDAILDYL